MKNQRTHDIENWHRTETTRATTLSSTLLDEEAREFLLRPALDSLAEVTSVILPNAVKAATSDEAKRWYGLAEFEITFAQKQLARAQQILDKYGPNVQFIGD